MKTTFFRLFSIAFVLATFAAEAQPPIRWLSRGIGGGGALYSPSINPSNNDEFSVACDMSELFRTMNYGRSYEQHSFLKINGGHNSAVQYVKTPGLLYCINYKMNGNEDRVWPAKSTDNGSSWEYLAGIPDNTETTYFLAADFDNPERLVMSYYGEVFFSSDGGANFHRIHTALDNGIGAIVGGVFFEGNAVVVGTNDGLLTSTDGGASFKLISNMIGMSSDEAIWSFAAAKQGDIIRFFCITARKSEIYAGMENSEYWNKMANIYSMDWNESNPKWQRKTDGLGLKQGEDYPMIVGMAHNDIATVYLAGGSASSDPIVLKSSDAGNSWVNVFITKNNGNIATGWSGDGGDRAWSYGECALGFTVAANNANRAVLTDYGFVHATSDGGKNWRQCYVSPEDENSAGNPVNAKKSYHSIGLENTTCWQVQWCDAQTVFACYSDIRGIRSVDGGETWSFNYTGHKANSMYRIARAADGMLYAATSNIHDLYQSTRLADNPLDNTDAEGKVIVSTDKGASWSEIKNFGHPVFWVAINPSNSKQIYASVIHSKEGGIYVSSDVDKGVAATWTKLPSPPRTEGHPAALEVLKDGAVVCIYSGRRAPGFTASSGCFVYKNGVWTDVSHPDMQYWCKDVAIDPHDASQSTWYVSVFSGWGGAANNRGGLFRTTDRGKTWTKIWNSDRVSSCSFHPQKNNELYVATEVEGLWHTSDIQSASPEFTRVKSYDFRQPERVFFNPYNSKEIWVSSFGNGMKKGVEASAGGKLALVSGITKIDFGKASRSKDFTDTLTNIGSADLVLADGQITGTGASSFSLKNSLLNYRLAPNDKVPILLTFSPAGAGKLDAKLTLQGISDKDVIDMLILELSGENVADDIDESEFSQNVVFSLKSLINPTASVIHLEGVAEGGKQKNATISIIDVFGREAGGRLELSENARIFSADINISLLASGVYWIIGRYGDKTITEPVIIAR